MLFDPMVALRAAPLLSATCSLFFGFEQSFWLSVINTRELRHKTKPLIQPLFTRFFNRGVIIVVSGIAVSFWSGLANLYVRRAALQSRGSFWWYVAGTVGALSHLTFVPLVAPSIKDITAATEGTDPNERLDDWIAVNNIRTLTVDLFAWAAFAVAVGKTFEL